VKENVEVFKLSDLNKIENNKVSLNFNNGNLVEIKTNEFIYRDENNSFGNLKILHLDTEGILHIGNFLKEENAFVLFSLPLSFFDGKIYGDIPFGIEEKDIENEPYGRLPGRGWDNIERLIEGMFFSKSFVDYTDGEKTISLIVHNGDRYFIWDKDKKILSHIMLRSFRRPNNWEKDINEKIEAIGIHKFKYSLVFQNKTPKTYKLSEILRNQPIVLQKFPKFENGKFDNKNLFIKIKPENIIETEGKNTDCEIELFFKPKKVKIVDLIGNEIENKKIVIEDRKIKFKIEKFEIISLFFTI